VVSEEAVNYLLRLVDWGLAVNYREPTETVPIVFA